MIDIFRTVQTIDDRCSLRDNVFFSSSTQNGIVSMTAHEKEGEPTCAPLDTDSERE